MTMPITTGTYLDRILANTVEEIEDRKRVAPLEDVTRRAKRQAPTISMRQAISKERTGIIAEVKRASPSMGPIAPDIDAAAVASAYIDGGCLAISVLTDRKFFDGSVDDLEAVSTVAHSASDPRPVLRKDFIIDPYQIVEARAAGADCVLLIVAALTDDLFHELYGKALELGMDALIEVHDENEVQRALAVEPSIIGINNRNLRTFDVDLGVTVLLAPRVPDGIAIVGESGVHTREDVLRLGNAGVNAVLVGESLMRQSDRAQAVRELLQ